jgi:plasmid stabilization system protein ParE
MNYAIEVRRDAEKDVQAASDWYDEQRPQLGTEFVNAFAAVCKVITERPHSFPTVFKNARRARVDRFPYSAIFRLEGKKVLVVAVTHASRDPKIWQRRL